jgi:hypothetical protein
VKNLHNIQHLFSCKSFFPSDDDFLRILVPIIDDEERIRNAEEPDEEEQDEIPEEDDDLDDEDDEMDDDQDGEEDGDR